MIQQLRNLPDVGGKIKADVVLVLAKPRSGCRPSPWYSPATNPAL